MAKKKKKGMGFAIFMVVYAVLALVGIGFGHVAMFDQRPFCVVYDADFCHFVFQRNGFLLHFPHFFSGGTHPVQCLGDDLYRGWFVNGKNTVFHYFFISGFVKIVADKEYDQRITVCCQIDGKFCAEIVGKRCIDDHDIVDTFEDTALCCIDAFYDMYGGKIGFGKQCHDGFVEFFRIGYQ